jgi:hypothetical protein
MFTLIRMLPARRLVLEQSPPLAAAWLVAELFYKFHSFSLECAAFLVTWFLFDGVMQLATSLPRNDRQAAIPGCGRRSES